jgi:lipopolysaccharide/colanic/teichoic acid biosynthesis glycosyltransferase
MTVQHAAHSVGYAPAGTYRVAKRALDVIVSLTGLILLAPLLLVLALAVWASSPGTPLFRQRRVGRGGTEFLMWKFRTMVADAERRRSELVARSRDRGWLMLDRDPRVTGVGRFLRRTSLDELPQLLNVLRGDMSLVGPRPLPVVEHALLPDWSGPRLSVRPGITGLWQVAGRTLVPFEEMLRLDCRYVSELSWRSDLEILVRTVPSVLLGKGAN